LNGQPLAKLEGTSTYYYHNDHLGTPQKLTDTTGTVVWAADYKPFGEATVTISTITNNLRFPGQYFDSETGLNYNYFRDYNAMIGRYIESDPAGLKGGINLYVYVENNAVNVADLLGLTPGVPTGIVTPGQFPNVANICSLGNGWKNFFTAISPSNQAWCAIQEEEKRITCKKQVEYLVVYKRYPLTFLGIEPATTGVLTDPATMDVKKVTLRGKKDCPCQ